MSPEEKGMNLFGKNKQPDLQTLLAYRKGTLSPKEAREVEHYLLDDPFMAEALEGFEEVDNFESIPEITERLNERILAEKTGKHRTIIPWWKNYRMLAAASIVLMIGAFFLFASPWDNFREESALSYEMQEETSLQEPRASQEALSEKSQRVEEDREGEKSANAPEKKEDLLADSPAPKKDVQLQQSEKRKPTASNTQSEPPPPEKPSQENRPQPLIAEQEADTKPVEALAADEAGDGFAADQPTAMEDAVEITEEKEFVLSEETEEEQQVARREKAEENAMRARRMRKQAPSPTLGNAQVVTAPKDSSYSEMLAFFELDQFDSAIQSIEAQQQAAEPQKDLPIWLLIAHLEKSEVPEAQRALEQIDANLYGFLRKKDKRQLRKLLDQEKPAEALSFLQNLLPPPYQK